VIILSTGDVVAVELLQESEWKRPSKVLAGGKAAAAAAAGDESPPESPDGSAAAADAADMPPVEMFAVSDGSTNPGPVRYRSAAGQPGS
jgi:hypothetical protein